MLIQILAKCGIGAILSQYQEDQKLYPSAYASRFVSTTKANYAITDLETLSVVWATTHFCYSFRPYSIDRIDKIDSTDSIDSIDSTDSIDRIDSIDKIDCIDSYRNL